MTYVYNGIRYKIFRKSLIRRYKIVFFRRTIKEQKKGGKNI
jgi:hypothetical protein